jgi:hypothetical protein
VLAQLLGAALRHLAADGLLPAVDDRIKVVAAVAGGYVLGKALPEVDPINFSPRIKVPSIMVNGR